MLAQAESLWPRISLVIVTAALGDGIPLSSGKQAHSFRAYLLRCHILPQVIAMPFHEVLVVGEFEYGRTYQYVPEPSIERSSIHDGLRKRQTGCAAASGDWIMVMNDDHLLAPDFLEQARTQMAVADVISPSRWTRMRGAPEQLNDGFGGSPWADRYVCGHGALYSREVLNQCPWDRVPKVFTLDVAHTQQIRDAGFSVNYHPQAQLWDVEFGAQPWR